MFRSKFLHCNLNCNISANSRSELCRTRIGVSALNSNHTDRLWISTPKLKKPYGVSIADPTLCCICLAGLRLRQSCEYHRKLQRRGLALMIKKGSCMRGFENAACTGRQHSTVTERTKCLNRYIICEDPLNCINNDRIHRPESSP